jgi:hypothetical protein
MKRLLLFLLLLSALPALAADFSSNAFAGIGPGYYYLYPKDTQLQNFYSKGMSWQAFLGIKANNGVTATLDMGYTTIGNQSNVAPFGTQLTVTPVTASLTYHFLKGYAISPYVGGGVGIYFIDESDPDFNYLSTTKFGKHIMLGADIYLSPDVFLRGELRQNFVDPVSSPLYYQANFGGYTALVALAMEWPLYRPEPPMTAEEKVLDAKRKMYENEISARQRELQIMEDYYRQKEWDESVYRRWRDRDVLWQEIGRTKEQIEADQKKAEEVKKQMEDKRQQYIEQKKELRQEKKESVINKK